MAIKQEELLGMTVNERLYAIGQLDSFDQAVSAKDIPAIQAILRSALIDDDNIRQILAAHGIVDRAL